MKRHSSRLDLIHFIDYFYPPARKNYDKKMDSPIFTRLCHSGAR